MERDHQLDLHARVAVRLKDAHARVRALQVPEGVRVALARKLLVITAAAKHDPAGAERRLGQLLTALDEGRLPGVPGPRGAEGPA